MLDLGHLGGRIVASRYVAPRPARCEPIPDVCHPALKAALASIGVEELYCHQAEMFRRALTGEDLVITTGTASGKSLAFLLPVLQAMLEDPTRRAILLYPTKALGQDQLRALLRFLEACGAGHLGAGVYDGDTPPAERGRIRERANLILTNPDMLNAGLLPNHGRRGFSHLLSNLSHLVVDEMHVYRGAFGAHFANVVRRLRRLCRHYGAEPRFLCSSATIANPAELGERLCGRPMGLVDQDGAPTMGKTIHFWQPPLRPSGLRRPLVGEMTTLLPRLVDKRYRFIAFCRSRRETEVVLKETRDSLRAVDGGHDESGLVAGYRGGYTPEERRGVEQALLQGKLLGVVSTNALELGVDIGSLELVVQSGFPGTRASFWQQVGRAGRRNKEAHALLLLAPDAQDQYIGRDPDWLVGRPTERAVVDPDNLMIQLAHVRAAAAELPLTLDDLALFPDLGEIIPVLVEGSELSEVLGAYHWCGGPYPAGDFSLRNLDGHRFKIVNRSTGTTITEMDRPQTFHEAFPRAVYLHDGVQYLVETLDLVGRVATVVPVEQNYYTSPDVRTKVDVLITQEERSLEHTRAWFGDVRVDATTVGYKMLEFHTHQNLGYEELEPRLTVQLETEAVWVALPALVHRVLSDATNDSVRGMVHALRAVARMHTMAERQDLVGSSFHHHDEATGGVVSALVLYDSHPGGLGYASTAFDHIEPILRGTLRLVDGCLCKDGCPACVGDPRIERDLVAWGLRSLLEETELPERYRCLIPRAERARPGAPAQPDAAPAKRSEPPPPEPWLDYAELPGRLSEVVAQAQRERQPGADLLGLVVRAGAHPHVLVLELDRPGAVQWATSEHNRERLRALLACHVRLPADLTLELRAAPEGAEAAARATHKLRRRLDDLTE